MNWSNVKLILTREIRDRSGHLHDSLAGPGGKPVMLHRTLQNGPAFLAQAIGGRKPRGPRADHENFGVNTHVVLMDGVQPRWCATAASNRTTLRL